MWEGSVKDTCSVCILNDHRSRLSQPFPSLVPPRRRGCVHPSVFLIITQLNTIPDGFRAGACSSPSSLFYTTCCQVLHEVRPPGRRVAVRAAVPHPPPIWPTGSPTVLRILRRAAHRTGCISRPDLSRPNGEPQSLRVLAPLVLHHTIRQEHGVGVLCATLALCPVLGDLTHRALSRGETCENLNRHQCNAC